MREVDVGQPLAAKAKGRQARCGIGETRERASCWQLRVAVGTFGSEAALPEVLPAVVDAVGTEEESDCDLSGGPAAVSGPAVGGRV